MALTPYLTKDGFYAKAKSLRQFFEAQFQDSTSLQPKRFVWDYWDVPNQYSLLRTPAYHYFPEAQYLHWHKHLVDWGRKNLGCWDISPPWLSYYVDGHYQNFHSDVPHGPWAFVYSLSPSRPIYTGGETLIFKPEVLSYWKNFGTATDREQSSFIQTVPSPYNRLTVFDPRFPHGVSQVKGVRNPLDARLVIHGWFTEPKTYIEGTLPPKTTENVLNDCFDQVAKASESHPAMTGALTVQLQVSSTGQVKKFRFATNTLCDLEGETISTIESQIKKIYTKAVFPKNKSATNQITVPLLFS